jgi:hypothetical protein
MVSSKLNFLTFVVLLILCGHFTTFPIDRENVPTLHGTVSRPSCLSVRNVCQVAINEMMVDPSPVVGLPDAEWIELYNFGSCTVSLKDWKLNVGTTIKVLPDTILFPDQYIIICSARFSAELGTYGRIMVLSTLPALRNSGNHLTLSNAADSVVDEIEYSDSWYGSSSKKNGGWSLERIDPRRSCGQAANWTASVHRDGGTPGKPNSVYAVNTDNEKPHITSASAISIHNVEIYFSEPMDTIHIKDKTNYVLSDGLGNPGIISISDDKTVRLLWNESFKVNFTYSLRLENLTDLCGNILSNKQVEIAWITLEQADVVINEVLFNPWPDGVDFVEVYNNSSKNIETGRLLLATRDENGQLKSQVSLKNAHSGMKPGDYLAFTTDTNAIFSFYHVTCRNCICQLASFPALNNDRGNIVLLNDSLNVLDEFTYSEDMHHPVLFDKEGVSLERINPDSPTRLTENWQSASSGAGYATPGYLNSQFQDEPVKHTTVTFEQTSISPNNDGYNDELIIRYKTQKPGWTTNCRIYDASGRMVCQLLKNSITGTSGEITWNGEDGNGQKLSVGPYIIFLEFFSMDDTIERYRKAVVVTEKGE